MNEMIIGMENLPNIFIDKIFVVSRRDGSGLIIGNDITLRVGAYDHIDKPRWLRDEMSESNLLFKVLMETNSEKIEMINSGTKSLFSYDNQPILNEVGGQLIPNAETTSGQKIFSYLDLNSIINVDYEYNFYYKDIKFEVSLFENISVYTAFFIQGLNFNNPLFDKFYGPVSGETIFSGGKLNTVTNYFYNPETNEEYGGPVHQQSDGGFMEGSSHSSMSHSGLIRVEQENFKISFDNPEIDIDNIDDDAGSLSSDDMITTTGETSGADAPADPVADTGSDSSIIGGYGSWKNL